jgi:hypothetical protein
MPYLNTHEYPVAAFVHPLQQFLQPVELPFFDPILNGAAKQLASFTICVP